MGESVEVDAIATTVLRTIVEDAVTRYIDDRALAVTRMVEAQERDDLLAMARGWSA